MLKEQTVPPDHGQPGARRHDALSVMFWPLALIGGALLSIAGEGPDFGHYTDWAAAAITGDVFTLSGNVLSPGGVPFTLAAAGPGLLFGVGKALFLPLTLGAASLLTGWVAAMVFWCASVVVLRRVADGDDWLALFGAAALFVGTHAGFYSHVYATEVFADALIAALWALVVTRTRWRWLDCAGAGALTGLLLLVRAHVALYAVPALWLAVFGRSVPAHSGEVSPGPGSGTPRLVIRMIATAVPLAMAIAEYATINRWMTGSLLHPPYVYGGAGFSSVDLRHPELAAVLAHPWHGLLSYHPLYGVAFVAVLFQAWRARTLRPLWVVTFLATIAHVWIQAGWYIWWLGGSSFGMRGMAPAALPLVAGLIAAVRQDAVGSRTRTFVWLGATVAASAWSYPLLLRGYSEFFSWPALIGTQREAFVAIASVLAVLVYIAASRRSRTDAISLQVRFGAVAGVSAAAAYVMWRLALVAAPGRVLMGLVAAAVLALLLRRRTHASAADTFPVGMLPRLGLIAALAVFALQGALFTRLAIRTERFVASGAAPPRQFEYVGSSPVDELRMTYAEYLGVPGFEARKTAFRRFLAWQRIESSNLAPDDRRVADAVRQRLDADPSFGDRLVEATARAGVVRITGSGISDAQESRVRQLAFGVRGVQSVTFSTN